MDEVYEMVVNTKAQQISVNLKMWLIYQSKPRLYEQSLRILNNSIFKFKNKMGSFSKLRLFANFLFQLKQAFFNPKLFNSLNLKLVVFKSK